MMKSRNEWMDIARFMAMLGIFFIHCKFPGTAGKFIGHMASLAVPFFFASSGYFNCYTDKKKCIKRFQHMCLIVVLANGFYFVYDFLEIVITKGNLTEFFKETFTVRKAVVFLILNESPLRGASVVLGSTCLLLPGALVLAVHLLRIKTRRNEIC